MAETLIKNFTQISKADTEIAGGKGASLGEMTQAGIPVPNGFVILSNAFDRFLEETDLSVEIDAAFDTVDIKEVHTIENASEKIQAMILSREIPENIKTEILKFYKNLDSKFVAVRSSATSEDSASAAWAGQLDSFLNTTNETLLENVKKCWASLFTSRAIFYRFEKDLKKDKISVAVVVQKMVDSEESGIAFSVHPVTQDENQIIIEAGFGLGEAIVSGSITPDSYVVDKQGFSILDINVNEQTKALYKKAKGGNEWKELGEKGKSQVLTEKEITELSKLIVKIENHYCFPCDIEWAKEKGKFFITQSRPITTLSTKQIKDKQEIKYILGNQDVDTSFLTLEITWSGIGTDEVKKHAGIKPLDSFLEIIKGKTINYYVESHRLKIFASACAKSLINNKELLDYLESETVKTTEQIRSLAIEYIESISKLTNQELISLLKQIKKLQAQATTLGSAVAFADIFGDITNGLISALKSRKNLKHSLTTYTHVLGSPAEKSLTEKAYDEIRTAKNKNELLQKYFWLDQGYIGRGLTIEHIDAIKEERKNEETYPCPQELKEELKLSENEQRLFDVSTSLIKIKSLRADSRQFLHVLTNKIIDLVAEGEKIQPEYLEALYTEEVCDILMGNSLPKDLQKRWMHSVVIPADKKYKFLVSKEAETFLEDKLMKEDIEDKETVKGQIAQPGKVKGVIKLVFGPQHNNKVKEGEILISRATSPQLLPAMKKAVAFVTDVGGITSHAAIVAREMKKPCVVGTKHATEIFSDGDLVEVDANEGIVKLIKKHNE